MTFSREAIDPSKPLKFILSHSIPKLLVQNASAAVENMRRVAHVYDMRSDHTLGIPANPIVADLIAVYPDPKYTSGRAQRQRVDSPDAPNRGFAIALIMHYAVTTLVGFTPLIAGRANGPRFPICSGAMRGCAILVVATILAVVVPVLFAIYLRPVAWYGSSGVRTASRIQMQGGQG